MKKIFTLLIFLYSFTVYSQDTIMIDGQPCGRYGSAKPGSREYFQNYFKNRHKIPTENEFYKNITLKDLIDTSSTKNKFSQDSAVEIIGYVDTVKYGSIETCNCKTENPFFQDTHIEITPNDKNIGKDYRLIVEVTPRIRQMLVAQGEDWTTENLKHKLLHHMIKIKGWLFYDGSHEGQSFSTNRANVSGKNWRATPWEIHPITSIEVLDSEDGAATDDPFTYGTESTALPINSINSSINKISTSGMETTPINLLIIILIGAILGAVGQGIRVIVGLKKMYDQALKESTPVKDLLEYQQLLISLAIGFAIGAVCGVLVAISITDISHLTKTTVIGFIVAGYAGTDFIEGFMKKNPGIK